MFHDIAGHERLTESIIGCAIRVHDAIGPGLLESIYDRCLAIELRESGLQVEAGRRVGLTYRDQPVDLIYIPDLIVEGTVILEIKAVERLTAVHQAQLITYLRLTGCPLGLLLNFHAAAMRAGIRRVVRPDLYRRRR
jgi:GxxExxY protein